tara:strand:- start:1885 stop:2520 length:636 start_codon:yes stop_codon:yes gene_type:complete
MYQEGENKFYYITTMNENYQQPEMPQGVEEGIVRGLYSLRRSTRKKGPRVQLMGAGTILREVEAAAVMLEQDYGVAADIWSLTSINELQREGKRVARWNLLHPEDEPRVPYLTEQLEGHDGPVVVATDYMKAHAEQLRQFIPRRYAVLGTDGYGRSDTRERLRRFFEVSREFVVLAALRALVDEGALKPAVVVEAMQALGISPDKIDPTTL